MVIFDDSPLDIVHKAYRRLTHEELVLFLRVRNLPTTGADADLASRLTQHDLHTYHFPSNVFNSRDPAPTPSLFHLASTPRSRPSDLPIEIIAEIVDHVGDWELSKAVGVPTSLPRPPDWSHASSTDHVMLRGCLASLVAADPAHNPPTKIGASLCVRFSYVNLLEHLFSHHHELFVRIFDHELIPIKASRHGRVGVLSWWRLALSRHPEMPWPTRSGVIADTIDGASRNGQVAPLDWWLESGWPFEYTESALEFASARNQISVLEWWKRHQERMPLKIGRVMDMASTAGHVQVLEWWATSQLEFKYDQYPLYHASCYGRIDVLDWWLGSGLQLKFDQDALIGATRHNRPEILEWWDKSGLPIQYRMCDIEEALEDAIGGGGAARAWWRRKGVDFNTNNKEWTKLQNLN